MMILGRVCDANWMDRKESGRVCITFGGSSAGAVLGAALELLGADPVLVSVSLTIHIHLISPDQCFLPLDYCLTTVRLSLAIVWLLFTIVWSIVRLPVDYCLTIV